MARLATGPSVSPASRQFHDAASGPPRAASPRTSEPPPADEALARALPVLACPACGGRLSVEPVQVRCQGCDAVFARDRVLRFVERAGYAESFGLQWTTFARVQLDGARLQDSARRLRSETGLAPEDVRGKYVLEAGCGMGRFLDVVSRDGAQLALGIDLSTAVDAAADNLGERPNVCIAQADLYELPLKRDSFDVVYSIGVLHHTPSAERAFKALVPFVKPGGLIAISVYAAVIKPGVPWAVNVLRRRAWRMVTKRLPAAALLWWARTAVPVLWVIDRIPLVRYVRYLFPVLIYRYYPLSWSVLDTFDSYATSLESRHRPKEVFRWFRELGLTEIDLLDSDDGWISVRARKPARAT